MLRRLALLFAICWSLSAQPAVFRHTGAGSTNGINVTTSGIDTRTATALYACVGWHTFSGATEPIMQDSQSNTWVPLTKYDSTNAHIRMYYVESPTTNISHTFTAAQNTGTAGPSVTVVAVSSTAASSHAQEAGNFGGGSVFAGPIVPLQYNEIVPSCVVYNHASGSTTVDIGTITDDVGDNVNSMGLGMSYVVQSGPPVSVNPQWVTGASEAAATIDSFKPLIDATKYVLLSSGACPGSGAACGGNSTTQTYTGGDTTGANLIAVCAGDYQAAPQAGDITDSKSNTYTMLTEVNSASNARAALFFTTGSITVGTGHNIINTTGGGSGFPGLAWAAFSGAVATPHDQNSGGGSNTSATALSPGSLTPSETNEILLSCLALIPPGTSSTEIIDSSFSVIDQVTAVNGGTNAGAVLAYQIQTTITARNPLWGWTGTSDAVATMESFKGIGGVGGGGGGGSGTVRHRRVQ